MDQALERQLVHMSLITLLVRCVGPGNAQTTESKAAQLGCSYSIQPVCESTDQRSVLLATYFVRVGNDLHRSLA